MESITKPLVKYAYLSKQLIEVNLKAKELREERQSVELDLTAAYAENASLPDKVELKQSKMMFHVKKPGEWKKGWTLSKKQLQDYLLEILPEHGEDVMKEIIRRHEPKLTTTDWSFEMKSIEE